MIEDAIQALGPTLAHLRVTRGAADEPLVLGTAFCVDRGGLLATAYHLVERAVRIELRGVGWPSPLPASLVAKDEAADVALLRVLASGLRAATLYDGPSIRLGREVVLLGFPYADVFEPPLVMSTRGIVGNRYRGSGVDRYVVDAVVGPGVSGAPLARTDDGRVIGVVSARFDPRRARAKLAGASEAELEALPGSASALTFAADVAYVRRLLARAGA